MTASKLEKYLEILKTITLNTPIKGSKVAYEVNITFNEAKNYLNFLVNQGLIERKGYNQKVTYAITRRGLSIVKHFGMTTQQYPVLDEIITS
jgi:predicted transcriptional regulator